RAFTAARHTHDDVFPHAVTFAYRAPYARPLSGRALLPGRALLAGRATAARRLSVPVGFPQPLLEDLAGAGPRQRASEPHRLRDLEPGDLAVQVPKQPCFGHKRPR